MLKLKFIVVVAILVSCIASHIQAITLDGNGYEFNIAISDQIKDVADDERQDFLQSIKDTMTELSKQLFQVTDRYFYLKTINILLPRSWTSGTGQASTLTAKLTYANADMRLEETIDVDENLVTTPRTKNSKPCGQPGEYIILPPQFFIDKDNSYTAAYGDKVKVLLHEFAHFRYGVFEEYGYPNEKESNGDKFPYAFTNIHGHIQLTSCNETEIKGFGNDVFKNCTLGEDQECRFLPDMDATEGPISSLMSMQFIPTVNRFCDASTHDRTAANKQNYWCRNRSINSVMTRTVDYVTSPRPQPLPPTTDTTPRYNYLLPVPPAVYIIIDTSNHTPATNEAFNFARTDIADTLLPRINSLSSTSHVGLATMSGSSISFVNNRLGGYLDEKQPTVTLAGNVAMIAQKVRSLTRSASGLLLEPSLLDVGDNLSPFTHQSGSVVFLVKLSDSTTVSGRTNAESEAVALLNSRNIRLVTVEIGETVLRRVTALTHGVHFSGTPTEYRTAFASAYDQITSYLSSGQKLVNRRVQLARSSFSATSATPATGYVYVDWRSSGLELNFFVPVAVSDVTIQVQGTDGAIYNPNESVPSLDGQYRVHVFSTATSPTGYWKYSIWATGSGAVSGLVDVVEVLPESAPTYIGGGGPPNAKPVEIEVYTSGNNGLLTMSTLPEDQSFLVYATVRKGASASNSLATVGKAFIRRSSTGDTDTIALKDDGIYPDMLYRDGIYTGRYMPPADGFYNISVSLERISPPTTAAKASAELINDPFRYAIPIDQSNYCCGQSYDGSAVSVFYQRLVPYAASLRVASRNFFRDRPTRIMDFKIAEVADDNSYITFTWTAPAKAYGSNEPVASYRLVQSVYSTAIIDELGEIPVTAPEISASDVLDGSLMPLPPGTSQSITVKLVRTPAGSPPPLYFTIGSVSNGIASYPAPMKYLPGDVSSIPAPTTTTTPTSTSTTTTTRTSTTTARTSTTISSTQTSSTASSSSTVSISSSPITTTTARPTTPSTSSISTISSLTVILSFIFTILFRG